MYCYPAWPSYVIFQYFQKSVLSPYCVPDIDLELGPYCVSDVDLVGNTTAILEVQNSILDLSG